MRKTAVHLSPEESALLVVDIQERLMPVIHERQRVVKNSILLIKAAKALGMPIIATTQYAARIGALLPEIVEELGEIEPLDKVEFDCFANRVVEQAAKALVTGVRNLIVCGVESHICIYQTVVGGLAGGFEIWVAGDAVSSRTNENYQAGLQRMREIGAVVGSTEMIIYDLLGRAGTPAFRELLPYLK
jgi:nicotinamidase-related amidase